MLRVASSRRSRRGGGEVTYIIDHVGVRVMSFDISRLRRADRIVGGGAIAFFIFLFFFKWYGVSATISGVAGLNVNVSKSGWDTFTNSRWIWLITIVVALGAVALTAAQRRLELLIEPGVIVAGLGALSTILILYRILHHPSASVAGFHAGIKIGIWLGLIAAAAVTYGGYLAMQEEGTSFANVREQAGDAFRGLSTSPGGGAAGSSGAPAPAPGAAEPSASPSPVAPPLPPPAAEPFAEPPAPRVSAPAPAPTPAAEPGGESASEPPPPPYNA